MNRELIQYIMQRMAEWLDNRQMIVLQNTLDESMKMTESRQKTKSSEELLTEFIAAKRLEGRSEGTLAVYKNSIGQLLGYTDRNVCVMTTEDIRNCLNRYQEEHGTSRVSLDNIRRNLSSFFKWLEDENHIFKSPVRRIHKIQMKQLALFPNGKFTFLSDPGWGWAYLRDESNPGESLVPELTGPRS